MIKIIKEAPKEYVTTCKNCGCQFSYELIDLNSCGIVKCPSCYSSCKHVLGGNVDTSEHDKYNSSTFTKGCHNCIYNGSTNNVCKNCVVYETSTPSHWKYNITVTNNKTD